MADILSVRKCQNVFKETSDVCSVSVGVYASVGKRASMEDVYGYIIEEDVENRLEDTERTKEKSKERNSESDEPIQAKKKRNDFKSEVDSPIDDSNDRPQRRISSDTKEPRKASFFVLCDGHGGPDGANFVTAHLFNKMASQINFCSHPGVAMIQALLEVENDFIKEIIARDDDGLVGTTVTAALIWNKTLYMGNLGDSQAVLCTKGNAVLMTECHSANNPKESLRVEQIGGVIVTDKRGSKRLAHPLWSRELVNIAITRSIGDAYFKRPEYIQQKESGLIAIPSCQNRQLTSDDQFLIIASDGLWDVMAPEEAVSIALQRLESKDPNEICKELVDEGRKRGSTDDITVLLVKFLHI